MANQRIVLIGVGGLGSVIAENLVQMGFPHLDLVDPDTLEVSNVSRVVGATYAAAIRKAPKVQIIAEHLRSINPDISVVAHRKDVRDPSLERTMASSDWIIVTSDTHSSRLRAQMISAKYFVPLISAGVNITVKDGAVMDISGEVITARAGDGLCLNCLGRINSAKVANESHPAEVVRQGLEAGGYVTGASIVEPAVKTLNSVIGALLVDILVNQYTGRQPHTPLLVFESNVVPTIYEDRLSLDNRNKDCFTCGAPVLS